jgi:ribose 5-phosphate isomerase B
MKIFIGADHNGFSLKETIKKRSKDLGVDFEDLGNTVLDQNDDYPDFAQNIGNAVAKHNGQGILICGSGQGICIAANKVKGIRAVTVFTAEQAKTCREHLNANIICLSATETPEKQALLIIKAWLAANFDNEARRLRRIDKIKQIENN